MHQFGFYNELIKTVVSENISNKHVYDRINQLIHKQTK